MKSVLWSAGIALLRLAGYHVGKVPGTSKYGAYHDEGDNTFTVWDPPGSSSYRYYDTEEEAWNQAASDMLYRMGGKKGRRKK